MGVSFVIFANQQSAISDNLSTCHVTLGKLLPHVTVIFNVISLFNRA